MLIQNDGKLETCPFRGPLFINKRLSREQLLKNNHKNGSQPKYFNKNSDTSNTSTTHEKIAHHRPKVNSFRSEDPYDHIHPIENIHDDTHIIDTKEQNTEYDEV